MAADVGNDSGFRGFMAICRFGRSALADGRPGLSGPRAGGGVIMKRLAGLSLAACGVAAVVAGYFLLRPAPDVCDAPKEIAGFRVPLPNTARALRRGKTLKIVAIGSSSTEGIGASDRSKNYPSRLAEELLRRFPDREINVVNKGIGGETASQMLVRFQKDVLDLKPNLVIWQLGSNAALKGVDPDKFEQSLREGVRRLKAIDVDIVLMDLQLSPRVLKRPAHQKIMRIIKATAQDTKVAVFRRFDAMQYWYKDGGMQPNDIMSRDQLHMNDLGYACVARLLASSLADAVNETAKP